MFYNSGELVYFLQSVGLDNNNAIYFFFLIIALLENLWISKQLPSCWKFLAADSRFFNMYHFYDRLLFKSF